MSFDNVLLDPLGYIARGTIKLKARGIEALSEEENREVAARRDEVLRARADAERAEYDADGAPRF